MNRPINRFLMRLNRGLSFALGLLLVTSLIVLTLDVLWGVFSRYLLGAQSPWTEELARLLLVWVAMFGGALAFGEGAHLGVDLIVEKLDIDARRITECVVQLLCIGFALYVMVWGGLRLTLDRFDSGQTLPALHVSKAWVYVAVPISGLLIATYGIEALLLLIFGADPAELHRKKTVDV